MPHHVPIEAVRALAVWAALSAAAVPAAWRPLARRTGRPPPSALALLVWTALLLAMTLPATAAAGAGGRLAACAAHPAAEAAWMVRTFGDRGLEDVMNVALWMPCGLLAAVATRRPAVSAAVLSAAFTGVELLQTLDPGRECDPGDMVYNSAGVALGALAGAALLRLPGLRERATDRSVR
ncbi:VanZ family protein [Actinomadura parmotrematis]|uniref:VanZ family protein n=1 Tax=Actinomadura parmotrematis TaxID=2864039 RepID=A0ABS7FXR2_9ACTN|nr:VanZ family protein [Actinomadura parmotrematis]MBW8484464.1 VanZ family protein [Actinomadura parmotrematis]